MVPEQHDQRLGTASSAFAQRCHINAGKLYIELRAAADHANVHADRDMDADAASIRSD
jgi:hypothetical protein